MLKGAMTIEQRQAAIKSLRAVKICPVTNSLPTTMTAEGFEAACERYREADKHQLYHARAYKHTWCDTCQGKQRPQELQIVSLAKLTRHRRRKEAQRKRPGNAGTFPGRRDEAQQA